MNVDPLNELGLTTPRLELRLGTREELLELGRLAQEGIHPPEEMPFAMAWTDRSGDEGFVESVVEFHEAALRDWRPAKWTLNLLVFARAGRPAPRPSQLRTSPRPGPWPLARGSVSGSSDRGSGRR